MAQRSPARTAASPVVYVRPGLPPFLLLNAEHDHVNLPPMAEELHRELVAHGVESCCVRVAGRNHNSLMFRVIEREDPAARLILDFVRRHAGP